MPNDIDSELDNIIGPVFNPDGSPPLTPGGSPVPIPPPSLGGSPDSATSQGSGNFGLPFPLPDDPPVLMSDGTYCFNSDVTICDSLDALPPVTNQAFNPDLIPGLVDILTNVSSMKLDVWTKLANSVKDIADSVKEIFNEKITTLESKIETIQKQVDQIKADIKIQIESAIAPIINDIESIQSVTVNIPKPEPITITQSEDKGVTVNVTIPEKAITVKVECPEPKQLDKPIQDESMGDTDTAKPEKEPEQQEEPQPVEEQCPVIDELKDATLPYWVLSDCGQKLIDEWLDKQGLGELKTKLGETLAEATQKGFQLQPTIQPTKPPFLNQMTLDLPMPLG